METTDYVSYPLALALKKTGFDWPCRDFYWTSDGVFKHTDALVHKNSEHCTTMIAAPTLAVAQKWLREKKELIILIGMTRFDDWFYGIYDKCGKCLKDDGTQRYSYEQALSAGISAALELIEEKGE